MDKNDFTWKIKFCPMVKDVAKWKQAGKDKTKISQKDYVKVMLRCNS